MKSGGISPPTLFSFINIVLTMLSHLPLCGNLEGYPCVTSGQEPAYQCRRCKRSGIYPWVKKTPWRRAWQPTLAWRIPWTEEPGGLWFIASQRVRHNWTKVACKHRNFRISLSISTKLVFWYFDWNCTESWDQIEKNWHLANSESSDPQTWNSPHIWMI